MSFAKAFISGKVLQEPEKRFTPGNNVTVTTMDVEVMSTSPAGVPLADAPFTVRVVCWRGLAESVPNDIHANDYVMVDGKLQIYSFQTPEGFQKKTFEIEAAQVSKLSGPPTMVVPDTSNRPEMAGAGYSGGSPNNPLPQTAPPQPQAQGGYASAPPAMQPQGGGGMPQNQQGMPAHELDDFLTEEEIPF